MQPLHAQKPLPLRRQKKRQSSSFPPEQSFKNGLKHEIQPGPSLQPVLTIEVEGQSCLPINTVERRLFR